MKTCSICKKEKLYEEFCLSSRSPDGRYPQCKYCKSIKDKKNYLKNKEKKKQQSLNYYYQNKENILEKRKETDNYKNYNKLYKEKNKEKLLQYSREYKKTEEYKKRRSEQRKLNRQKENEYNRERLKNNPIAKLAKSVRNRLNEYIRLKGFKKLYKFQEYIGCSPEELKNYIETKFIPGMTWDNHGDWHIDHIIPLISANTSEELYKLCHYSNLQPLWALDNISKNSKIIK